MHETPKDRTVCGAGERVGKEEVEIGQSLRHVTYVDVDVVPVFHRGPQRCRGLAIRFREHNIERDHSGAAIEDLLGQRRNEITRPDPLSVLR